MKPGSLEEFVKNTLAEIDNPRVVQVSFEQSDIGFAIPGQSVRLEVYITGTWKNRSLADKPKELRDGPKRITEGNEFHLAGCSGRHMSKLIGR